MDLVLRRSTVCLGIILLFTGCQVKMRGQERVMRPDTAEMLDRAIRRIRLYACGGERTDLNPKDGSVMKVTPIDAAKASTLDKLSLQILFKRRRYRLSPGFEGKTGDGRPAYVIDFVPQPKDKQLEAEGEEDANYNKAMNHLEGSVFLDPTTYEVLRIEARLPEKISVSYRPKKALLKKVVELKTLEYTFEQGPGNSNRPSFMSFDIQYWRARLPWDGGDNEIRELYTGRFNCGI